MTTLPAIVVVGAGQAGLQLALSLREGGHAGPVTLIGDEEHLPYQRPPLSKAYLAGKADAASVTLRSRQVLDEQRITLQLGKRVAGIDRGASRLVLRSGERVPYDHLVLATGARNRVLPVPGAELPGVVQLRGLDDAAAMKVALDGARSLIVVGAGFIGLEAAAVAAARGLPVTVIEAASRIMARAVSPELSAFMQAAHEGWGVRFRLDAAVARIVERGGSAAGVGTADGGRIEGDLVLVGIGVVPNDELARESGLATLNGIIVDETLATSDPTISAVGDCAAHPSRFAGGASTRIESVQNAIEQARHLAARLAGAEASPYADVPWFWSDQGSMKLQIAGLAGASDSAVPRVQPDGRSLTIFRFADGRLSAVETVDRPADHMVGRRLLAGDIALTPDQVSDPGFDLRAVLRSLAPQT